MSINDEIVAELLKEPWLPARAEGTAFLAKFYANTATNTFAFVITDTKTVWSEVIKTSRLSRRYQTLNGNGDNDMDTWETGRCIDKVKRIHRPREFEDLGFVVSPGSRTDFVISLEEPNFTWSWEVDSIGYSQSSHFISQHLIIPLIITTGMAFNSTVPNQAIGNLSAMELESSLDKVVKVAKRNPSLNIVQAMKKPRLSTALQRVTAVIHDVNSFDLPKVVVSYEDHAIYISENSMDLDVPSKSETPRQKAPEAEAPLFLVESLESSIHASSNERKKSPPAPIVKKELSGSETEDEEEDSSLVTNRLNEKKQIDSDSEPDPPSKRRRVARLSSEGEEDIPRVKPSASRIIRDDDDAPNSQIPLASPLRTVRSPAPSNRGGSSAGVKQPIRRGGRRV